MIRSISTLVFLMALALLSLSAHALELADNPLVLDSEDGVQATIAPTVDGNQALMRITGVDHPLDGVVLLADIEQRENDERAYRAEVEGRMHSLILFASSHWAPTDYTAYIPGQEEPRALAVDKDRSSSADLQALQEQYQQQQEQGLQQQLARFDREKAVRRQRQTLGEIDESASEVCGQEVTTRVNWESLDDDQLNNLNISGYCGQVAAEMEYLCRRDEQFREKVAGISAIDCGFSDALDLSRDSGKLVFQTRKEARNQRETINDFLRKL